MRTGALPLESYAITTGLNKHPSEYPDSKTLPHVAVAKQMLKNQKNVNKGDHIPYVICQYTEEELELQKAANNGQPTKKSSGTDRAHHPEEVARSNGKVSERSSILSSSSISICTLTNTYIQFAQLQIDVE